MIGASFVCMMRYFGQIPFEDMPKVLSKICLEPCRIVLVVPQWRDEDWTELLSKMQTKKCDIPPKFPIYETAKGPGIWVDLIGGLRLFL